MLIWFFGRDSLELRSDHCALADDPVPTSLVSLGKVDVSDCRFERDRLNACGSLAFPLTFILRSKFRNRVGLTTLGRFAQHVPLHLVQPVPRISVHKNRHFGAVQIRGSTRYFVFSFHPRSNIPVNGQP